MGSEYFYVVLTQTKTKTTHSTKVSSVATGLKFLKTKPKSDPVVGITYNRNGMSESQKHCVEQKFQTQRAYMVQFHL